MGWKAGLLLVEVDGDQLELVAVALLQHAQHVEHSITVFATRHAHHHLVAVFDQAKVANGLGHLAHQALFELERGVRGGLRGRCGCVVALHRGGCGRGGGIKHGVDGPDGETGRRNKGGMQGCRTWRRPAMGYEG